MTERRARDAGPERLGNRLGGQGMVDRVTATGFARLAERTRMANLPERLLLYRYSDTQVSHRHVLAQHIAADHHRRMTERRARDAGPERLGNRLGGQGMVDIRRDLLESVGGYRAAYRHCEDYDLWLRLAERTRMAIASAVRGWSTV
jgi:hypothetical protein